MLLPAGFDLSFIDMIKIDAVKSVLYISKAYSGPQCRRDYMRNLAILGDISKNL